MMCIRWRLLAMAFYIYTASGALAIDDDCEDTKQWQTRRLSIYAYSKNAFLETPDIECTPGHSTCDKAFDGEGTDDEAWEPGKPSIIPVITITNIRMNRIFSGRFLCKHCIHYLGRYVELKRPNEPNPIKALIRFDPFDVRGDVWYRFDVLETTGTTNLTISFPATVGNGNERTAFIEIELHKSTSLMAKVLSPECESPTEAPPVIREPTQPLVLIRVMAIACEDISQSWWLKVTIMMMDDTNEETTLTMNISGVELDQGQTSMAALKEMDRIRIIDFSYTFTVTAGLEGLLPRIEMFYDKSELVKYTYLLSDINCSSDSSGSDLNTCTNIIDGDPETHWLAHAEDSFTMHFSTNTTLKRFRLKQKNVEEIVVRAGGANKCDGVTMRSTIPAEASEWVTIQQNMRADQFTFIVQELHDFDSAKIFEMELFGEEIATTTIQTTRATTYTTTTTMSSVTTPTATSSTSLTSVTAPTHTSTSSTEATTTSAHTEGSSSTRSPEPTQSSVSTSQGTVPSQPSSSITKTVTSVTPTLISMSSPASRGTESTTGSIVTSVKAATEQTTEATSIRPAPTQPDFKGDKLQYFMYMKVLDQEFKEGMDDVNDSQYWKVYDVLMPLVVESLDKTEGDRVLGTYNVSFSNGSIEMTHNFDLKGLAVTNKGTLEDNLRGIFNESGIVLGAVDIHDPKELREIKSLLTVALVSAVACLAVVATVVTVLCVRRRCQRDDERAASNAKDPEDSSSNPAHLVPFTGGTDNRMWQRVDTLTAQTWHSEMMLVAPPPPFDVNGLENPRYSTTSIDENPAYFSYPDQNEPPTVHRGGYSLPDMQQPSTAEDLGYWGAGPSLPNMTPDGFDPPTPDLMVPSENMRPRKRYLRQVSHESRGTNYSRGSPSSQDDTNELDFLPVGVNREVEVHPVPAQLPRSRQDSLSNGDELSSSSAAFVLPKFYRDQDTDTSYSGFFISRDIPEIDAFEMPTSNPLGLGSSLANNDSAQRAGLHRVEREAPDTLDPMNPPFPIMEIESVNSDEEGEVSTTMSDSSGAKDQNQYDSGYDDALKIYWADPRLDDRTLIQRISHTFGRSKKPDMLHREMPAYLKSQENKKSATTKTKSNRDETDS